MKKVLLTGSAGILGSAVASMIRDSYDTYGTYKNVKCSDMLKGIKIDLTNEEAVLDVVGSVKPDFIIHCAALTDVDFCESNYDMARSVNALATKYLASSIGDNARFIYISTDSVFDGHAGDYGEDAPVAPLNNYAKTKFEGERFVEESLKNYVIIRTTFAGFADKDRESFADWVWNNLRKSSRIDMFTDVIFSPLYVNTLARYIVKLISLTEVTGKLNIGSADSITKYDFGIKLAKAAGFDASLISPTSVNLIKLKARRPKNTSLNISKARAIFGDMPLVEEEITKLAEGAIWKR